MSSLFSIKSIDMVNSWTYNLPKNTECTICRTSLNCPSLYNQDKGLDSFVVSGVCGHSYHYECIKPWVEKNKYCAICMQEWKYETTPKTEIKDIKIKDINKSDNISGLIKHLKSNITNLEKDSKENTLITKLNPNPKAIQITSTESIKKINIIKKKIPIKKPDYDSDSNSEDDF